MFYVQYHDVSLFFYFLRVGFTLILIDYYDFYLILSGLIIKMKENYILKPQTIKIS